ncbi:hypothetical protein OY671_010236, partial [Metschnikowia pulcherrima]
SGSEEASATMTCERSDSPAPRSSIGGYGMGFTSRAASGVSPADARVTVAESVPEIIAWARGPMATLTAGGSDDPRVHSAMGDVARAIEIARSDYDAISLDVPRVEPLSPRQDASEGGRAAADDTLAASIDRLSVRSGADRVTRSHPAATHIPEAAQRSRPAIENTVSAPVSTWPLASGRDA